jgi:SM-20-related protein
MSGVDGALPGWWGDASPRLASAADANACIERGVARFDATEAAAQLCARGFAVIDGFLGGRSAVDAIRKGIRELDAAGALHLGKIQHGTSQSTNDQTRSDRIGFIPSVQSKGKAAGTVQVPAGSALQTYVEALDGMRARLSDEARLVDRVGGSLDDCNFMCAVYPGGGARYVKHRDALPYKAGRKLTVIYYVNGEWEAGHGGELVIWPSHGDPEPVTLPPRADRLVLFVSSLEHEVLPAWRPRFALTTWMFNRRDTALEVLAEDMRQRKAAGKMNTAALLAALDADSSSDDDGGGGAEEEGDDRQLDRGAAMSVMMQLLRRKQSREGASAKEGASAEPVPIS